MKLKAANDNYDLCGLISQGEKVVNDIICYTASLKNIDPQVLSELNFIRTQLENSLEYSRMEDLSDKIRDAKSKFENYLAISNIL